MQTTIPEPFSKSSSLMRLLVRVSKEESAYLYFTLEACDGLSFHSTLTDSLNKGYRDIMIHTTPELYPELLKQLNYCKQSFEIEFLKEEAIQDSYQFSLDF